MPLEDLTGPNAFLDALNVAWPLGSDQKYEGDDHIRGVKNTLVNTFGALDAFTPPVPYNPSPSSGNRAGAIGMSFGATGDRPTTPAEGDMRWNSTLNKYEHYRAGGWFSDIVQLNSDAGTQTFKSGARFDSTLEHRLDDDGTGSGPTQYNTRIRTSQGNDSWIGRHNFRAANSVGGLADFAGLGGRVIDATDGSEEGQLLLGSQVNGAYRFGFRLGTCLFGNTLNDVGPDGSVNATEILKDDEDYHRSYDAVATTSGSSHQQTGLRASKKQVVVNFFNVSTTGTAPIEVKLGTSAGYPTSGYDGNVALVGGGTGVDSWPADAITPVRLWGPTPSLAGRITLDRIGSTNDWIVSGNAGMTEQPGFVDQFHYAGVVSLPGELDRVQVETANAFDGGSFAVQVIG